MNTELASLQNQVTILKQQNEIIELRYKLQKTQAYKASRLEDSLFSPSLYEHYQKVAVTLSKSGVIPNAYKGKPEDIFVAMAMGYQLGFPVEQSLQDIAVVNGRPCLWGDGLLSLALNHPECQSIKESPIFDDKGNVIGYQCTVIRKGHEPHTKQFTLQDAHIAGLLSRGTVWKSYPERMLQMRARSFALRDKFADALRGLRIAEIEAEDSKIINAEVVPIKFEKEQRQTDKLKSILKKKQLSKEGENQEINEDLSSEKIEKNISTDAEKESSEQRNSVHYSGRDDQTISKEQADNISLLMEEKEFSQERIKKALEYYKVESLEQLTDAQARIFLLQLEKA